MEGISKGRWKRFQRKSKKVKRKHVGEGCACPKCHLPMLRLAHDDRWKPKSSQPFYFKYWDRCLKCRHLQHYEAAKVWVNPQDEPLQEPDHLTAAFKATLN